jgi:putative DNA primase/helicase
MESLNSILTKNLRQVEPLTPEGIAIRFNNKYTGKIYKIEETGQWLIYFKGRFITVSESKLTKMIFEIIISIPGEAQGEKYVRLANGKTLNAETLKVFRDKIINSSHKKLFSLVSMFEGILISDKAFDQKSDEIVVKNGILNLKTGELRDHDPKCMSTRITKVAYKKDATCPLFKKFIAEIANYDKSLEEYLQRWFGYCLTSENKEQKINIFFGNGSNGKSLLFNVISIILKDYCITGHSQAILKNSKNQTTSDLNRWRKARLVILLEINQDERLDEGVVKVLTGLDKIVSRQLYKNFESFEPEFKVALVLNHLPSFKSGDFGIERRLEIIPFLNKFTGKDDDKDLLKKLIEELEGIFAWMVEGARAYYKKGMPNCKAVESATKNYIKDMDGVTDYLNEYCIVDQNNENIRTSQKLLWKLYEKWQKDNSDHPLIRKEFTLILKSKNFKVQKSGNARYWKGIKIKLNFTQK